MHIVWGGLRRGERHANARCATSIAWARLLDVRQADILMSDGEGHAMATDWRGASSFKPCFFCWNLLKKDSGITDPEFADVTETDTRRFKPTIRSNLYREFDDLLALKAQVDAGARGNTELERLDKSVGYSANPHGVLADRQLRRAVAIPTCQVLTGRIPFCKTVYSC